MRVLCSICCYCTRCPENAIEIGPQGQIIVSPTLCTACGICERLCPVGAIEIYREVAHVCDLCGGQPRCADQCPMGAIAYVPEKSETIRLKDLREAHRGLTPEAKRLNYAIHITAPLRAAWADRGRA